METTGDLQAPKSFKQALLRSRFNENGNEKNFDNDVEVLSSDDEDAATPKASEKEDEEMQEERDWIPRVRLPAVLLKKIREPWKKCLICETIGENHRLQAVHDKND